MPSLHGLGGWHYCGYRVQIENRPMRFGMRDNYVS